MIKSQQGTELVLIILQSISCQLTACMLMVLIINEITGNAAREFYSRMIALE